MKIKLYVAPKNNFCNANQNSDIAQTNNPILNLTIFLILFHISFVTLHAQKKEGLVRIDSLKGALGLQKDYKPITRILDSISFEYNVFDPALGIRYGDSALKISNMHNWADGMADAYNSIGSNYVENDPAAAIQNYEKSLHINDSLQRISSPNKVLFICRVAANYNNIARTYLSYPLYTSALLYYKKAIHEYEGISNPTLDQKKSLGTVYRNYAEAYCNIIGKSSDSINIFLGLINKSILWNKSIDNYKDVSAAYITLSTFYKFYNLKPDYDRSLYYLELAYELTKEHQNLKEAAIIISSLGMLFTEASDSAIRKYYVNPSRKLDTAIAMENKALRLTDISGDKITAHVCYLNLYDIYIDKGNCESSLNFYQKAENIYVALLLAKNERSKKFGQYQEKISEDATKRAKEDAEEKRRINQNQQDLFQGSAIILTIIIAFVVYLANRKKPNAAFWWTFLVLSIYEAICMSVDLGAEMFCRDYLFLMFLVVLGFGYFATRWHESSEKWGLERTKRIMIARIISSLQRRNP